MPRNAVFLAGLALLLAACAGPDSAAHLLEQEPIANPSVSVVTTVPPTTTSSVAPTTLPADPEAADRAAQTELRAALVAARAIYVDRSSYDAPLSEVERFAPEVTFIDLTDAYAFPGVVYDAHDQRVTLHRRSDSGRWFCIDESVRTGTDFGFGDTFEDALATCGDGTRRSDWSSAYGPIGDSGDDPATIGADEAAILHAFERLTEAIDEADHNALRATVFESTGCSAEELSTYWPDGLDLFDSVTFDITEISVHDGTGTVSLTILGEEILDWRMIQYGIKWYHDRDPCPLLEARVIEPQNQTARDLLEDSHLATQTAFVRSENFSLSLNELNAVNPEITFVSAEEARYGYTGYVGTREYGVMFTQGAPGMWYCIVEYLRRNTGYGVGATREDVDSAAECNQSTEGWPEPE